MKTNLKTLNGYQAGFEFYMTTISTANMASSLQKKTISIRLTRRKKGYQSDTLYTISLFSKEPKTRNPTHTMNKTAWVGNSKGKRIRLSINHLTTDQSSFHHPVAAAVDPAGQVSRQMGCCSGSRRSLFAPGIASRACRYTGPAEAAAVRPG